MPGRPLVDEKLLLQRGFIRSDFARRRQILRETLRTLEAASPGHYQQLAARNLARWKEDSRAEPALGQVQVRSGDWGEVARALTVEHGELFAVLNMANAYVPGGGYVEGMPAQEENLFRRTDCHFHVGPEEYDRSKDLYLSSMTALLNAESGVVYLDTDQPRVCIRGPEIPSSADLGYHWLRDDEVFPFWELRASAQDLREGRPFDQAEARRRIVAQLDTLRAKGVRYAVLGAFGCGAFLNPADVVAELYAQELAGRRDAFAVIAFAIYDAGYGPDNYAPFAKAFARARF